MRGSLDLRPAAADWWKVQGVGGAAPYVVLPLTAGGLVVWSGNDIEDLGSIITGLFFIGGFLLDLSFRMLDWSRESTAALVAHQVGEAPLDRAARGRHHRRMEVVAATYNALTWASLAALAMLGLLVTAATAGPDEDGFNTVVSAFVAAGSVHVVLVLLSVVNRAFLVMRQELDKHLDDARD